MLTLLRSGLRLPRTLLFALALCSAAFGSSAVRLQPGDTVAICGDSITEQKRYSVYLEDYLLMCQPAPGVRLVQFGWGGDTSWGFASRMQANVLPFRPTVATTCFGMNDGGYAPVSQERQDRYRKALEEIVSAMRGAGVRALVLGTPGVVDTGTFKRLPPEVYNKTLASLGEVAHEVAERNETGFADVHSIMLEVMAKAKAKYGPDFAFAGEDGVHPGSNGHLVMAYAFLKALGCDGDIGALTWDFEAGTARGSAGHKVVKVSQGELVVESTRYPFCFFGGEENLSSTRKMLEFLPFNQELNRYLLVVKNLPSGKVRLAWGKEEKVVDSSELERGVNLADLFLDNPFGSQFLKVEAAVKEKQAFETDAVKVLLNALPSWTKYFPAEAGLTARLRAQILEREESLAKGVRETVVPVRHTLSIRPL